ncbi:MAG: hypothetical protein ACP5II_01005 [Infirmifilum sp.]|jgi:hypothetical protein|uniref:Uncharacterized protein n=1 Tax=Infirmifilum uzonense TaxID=1550241 RepID=A0A0F7CKS1_9CREN|nr:hypothetical protein [Infirmifilum uzonense]AKG38151.1 hypothetical protein MA03_01025 [Infirmifilum uzonense]
MSKDTTLLEKLELMVPGFRGYKQKELIREDDALVRRKIASILDDARIRVERLISAVKKKNISAALRLDDLRLELMKASQMIKHASYGYSGLFDRVKIREKELQTLLELDYKLLTQASKVMEKVLELSTVTDQELMEKINNAIDIVRQMEDDINQRENLFKTVVSE